MISFVNQSTSPFDDWSFEEDLARYPVRSDSDGANVDGMKLAAGPNYSFTDAGGGGGDTPAKWAAADIPSDGATPPVFADGAPAPSTPSSDQPWYSSTPAQAALSCGGAALTASAIGGSAYLAPGVGAVVTTSLLGTSLLLSLNDCATNVQRMFSDTPRGYSYLAGGAASLFGFDPKKTDTVFTGVEVATGIAGGFGFSGLVGLQKGLTAGADTGFAKGVEYGYRNTREGHYYEMGWREGIRNTEGWLFDDLSIVRGQMEKWTKEALVSGADSAVPTVVKIARDGTPLPQVLTSPQAVNLINGNQRNIDSLNEVLRAINVRQK
jgi:hypothetical protein